MFIILTVKLSQHCCVTVRRVAHGGSSFVNRYQHKKETCLCTKSTSILYLLPAYPLIIYVYFNYYHRPCSFLRITYRCSIYIHKCSSTFFYLAPAEMLITIRSSLFIRFSTSIPSIIIHLCMLEPPHLSLIHI